MATNGENINPAQAYQDFLVPNVFLPWTQELLRRVPLNRGDKVLDIACGTGVVSREVAKLVGPQGSVTGLDMSPAMLDVARASTPANGTPIQWQQGSAQDLPFDDDVYDATFCQQALQFFPDRAAAVKEMRRVLKRGGRVGVSVSGVLEHQPLYHALFTAMEQRFGREASAPFSFEDDEALRSLFVDAGFQDVTVEVVQRQVQVPSVDQFVAMSVMSAAAAVPALMNASGAERLAAIEEIKMYIHDDLDAVRVGEGIKFLTEWNILVATA